MLSEITDVKKQPGEPKRRWFSDASLDLYVWYDEADNIIQFQICYDKGPDERALTWNNDQGITHHAIDDGENRTFRMKSTPILVADGDFNEQHIIQTFEALAKNIEYGIVRFVLERIQPDDSS